MTPFLKTKADKRVMHITTTLWTNFAKYGNPNSTEFDFEWDPVSQENPSRYLVIDEKCELKEKPDVCHLDKLLPVLDAFYATLSASNI